MIIIWNFLGEHILYVKDNAEWHLYVDFDQYDVPNLYLEIGVKKHVIADGSEILQGREQMRIDQFDVMNYYSGVAREVAELLSLGNSRMINIAAIQEHLLHSLWWPKWLAEGRVTDDLQNTEMHTN